MNKLLVLLVLCTSIYLVGCGNQDMTEQKIEPTDKEVTKGGKEKKLLSSDALNDIYKSKLPAVKKIFRESGIKYENMVDNSKNLRYDSVSAIKFEDTQIHEEGKYSYARYGLTFGNNGDIEYVSCHMKFAVDENKIKESGFKFEDTDMYAISSIISGKNKDYSTENEEIANYYNSGTPIKVERKSDNITETFKLSKDTVEYLIKINP